MCLVPSQVRSASQRQLEEMLPAVRYLPRSLSALSNALTTLMSVVNVSMWIRIWSSMSLTMLASTLDVLFLVFHISYLCLEPEGGVSQAIENIANNMPLVTAIDFFVAAHLNPDTEELRLCQWKEDSMT